MIQRGARASGPGLSYSTLATSTRPGIMAPPRTQSTRPATLILPQDKPRIDAIESGSRPLFSVRFLIPLLLCLLAGPLSAPGKAATPKEKTKEKAKNEDKEKEKEKPKPKEKEASKPKEKEKEKESAKPKEPDKEPAKPKEKETPKKKETPKDKEKPKEKEKEKPKPLPVPEKPGVPAKPSIPPPPKVEWKPIYYKGRAYVPANQVAAYYDLQVPALWQKTFTLYTPDRKFTIECTTGEKRIKLSGWTFYFSFPVVEPKDMPMISVFDVRNILDPILRPNDRRDPAILRTVVIDPSGGGKDTGIRCPFIAEKELTLAVAKHMVPLLEANGYRVLLTRAEDKAVLPGLRIATANDVAEEAIYLNLRAASGPGTVRGFECATLPPAGTPATVESDSPNIDKRFFAGNINDRESLALATTIQNSVIRNARTLDLGIKRVRVEELRDIRMPAISCKLGYLSHKEEAKKLSTPEYQVQLASAIVQGVDRYAAFLRSGYEARVEEDRKRPLSFGPATVKQEPAVMPPGAEKIALRLPIVGPVIVPVPTTDGKPPSTATNIDRSKMELQIFLFEKVNDAEIDLSTANPPEVTWLSVLPDWQAGVPEWLQITYIRPAFSPPELKAYGNRSYYGYVARLIYDGRVLDETSFPPNLNRALFYFTPVFPKR